MSNKSFNKGFDPGYDYLDFVKYSRKGNPEGKRIFQKWRRRKLDRMINEQLAEMEEVENVK